MFVSSATAFVAMSPEITLQELAFERSHPVIPQNTSTLVMASWFIFYSFRWPFAEGAVKNLANVPRSI
jgi:hypothetical protein